MHPFYALRVVFDHEDWWYSAIHGLVPMDQMYLRTRFDSRIGAEIAKQLLEESRRGKSWAIQIVKLPDAIG